MHKITWLAENIKDWFDLRFRGILRVRMRHGTDTFDAGTINISFDGPMLVPPEPLIANEGLDSHG